MQTNEDEFEDYQDHQEQDEFEQFQTMPVTRKYDAFDEIQIDVPPPVDIIQPVVQQITMQKDEEDEFDEFADYEEPAQNGHQQNHYQNAMDQQQSEQVAEVIHTDHGIGQQSDLFDNYNLYEITIPTQNQQQAQIHSQTEQLHQEIINVDVTETVVNLEQHQQNEMIIPQVQIKQEEIVKQESNNTRTKYDAFADIELPKEQELKLEQLNTQYELQPNNPTDVFSHIFQSNAVQQQFNEQQVINTSQVQEQQSNNNYTYTSPTDLMDVQFPSEIQQTSQYQYQTPLEYSNTQSYQQQEHKLQIPIEQNSHNTPEEQQSTTQQQLKNTVQLEQSSRNGHDDQSLDDFEDYQQSSVPDVGSISDIHNGQSQTSQLFTDLQIDGFQTNKAVTTSQVNLNSYSNNMNEFDSEITHELSSKQQSSDNTKVTKQPEHKQPTSQEQQHSSPNQSPANQNQDIVISASQVIKQRNWRQGIEKYVGYDKDCYDEMIEELKELELDLFIPQVQEYKQLVTDIDSLRNKKHHYLETEEFEVLIVIRDTLRAKEPIANSLKQKILYIANIMNLFKQQPLSKHVSDFLKNRGDQSIQQQFNHILQLIQPIIVMDDQFVNKLQKELQKATSILRLVKLRNQLEVIKFDSKYLNFINGLKKIIQMSCRFSQLQNYIEHTNDALVDLKLESYHQIIELEYLLESTLIPFLHLQESVTEYCQLCFQAAPNLTTFRGKKYHVYCVNFNYQSI